MIPLRLAPGDDLRAALDAARAHRGLSAAFVLQGIGSLTVARLRFAGAHEASTMQGDIELLSLGGSLSESGSHLHMSIADAAGRVHGGHVAPGCIVRTTVELVLLALPEHRFTRAIDAATGFAELVITPLHLR